MFKKNTAVVGFGIGHFINTTTGAVVTTGTPTCKRTLDGTGGACANAAAYNTDGAVWEIDLAAADMNGDAVILSFTLTDCLPISYTIKTVTKLVSDLKDETMRGTDNAALASVLGAAVGATISADIAAVKVDTTEILLDTGTHGVILPQTQADKVWGTTVRTLSAAGVQAIWDSLTSAFTTVGSIGKKLADWIVGTIDTYSGNTKQTGDSFTRLGAPAGASVSADVAAIKAKTDNLPAAPADDTSIDTQLGAIHNNVTGIIGYVDTEVAAVKAVTDKLNTALELDVDVYRFTANALEQAPSGGATVAQIADGVWDEAAADHVAAGSMGKKLNDVTGGSAVNIQHDSTVIVTDS